MTVSIFTQISNWISIVISESLKHQEKLMPWGTKLTTKPKPLSLDWKKRKEKSQHGLSCSKTDDVQKFFQEIAT